MSEPDPKQLYEVFLGALELPAPERQAYLLENCADGAQLAMLEDLLRADAANQKTPPQLLVENEESFDGVLARARKAAASDAARDLKPDAGVKGSQIGRYILQSELGRGGMGVVYLALQESTSQLVALKCLRPTCRTPKLVQRFEQEVQVLGQLDHVGIARIFDAGSFESEADVLHYFAMEYVRGKTLVEYAAAQELDVRARLGLLAQVCDAVHHAHEHGIVHRDLKPANILVTAEGQPKVLDFGVSRVVDRDLQLTTIGGDGARLIGTLRYMSPEQAGGEESGVDKASDVYALGVILYELLSGRLPHDLEDKTLLCAARTIRDRAPRPLRSALPTIATEVETIVGKALEQEAGRRYGTAAAMAQDLRRYLHHEPIEARPPSTIYSLVKFARRHRTLAGSTLAVFVILIAAAGLSLHWALDANRARRAAEWSSYRTTLNLSESDLRQEQHSRAKRNLAAVPPRLRGWEWRYLQQRADQSLQTIEEAHWILIWSVALAPDGQRAYSCAGDSFVRAWDLSTGELLAETDDHAERVFAVAASADGRHVASSAVDVRIRAAATLEVKAKIEGHTGTIHGLCYSPDGQMLASGDQNGKLLLSSAEDGHLLREFLGQNSFIWEIAFSRDGEQLAAAAGDGRVVLWNVLSPDPLLEVETDGGRAMGLDFSPDGGRLVIASSSGELRVVRCSNGEVLGTWLAHTDQVRDVLFSVDGSRIISASEDRTIAVWDAVSFEPIARLVGHTDGVASLAMDARGERLLSASMDRTLKSWDTRVFEQGNLHYPLPQVVGLGRAADPETFYSLDSSGSISRRSFASGAPLHSFTPRDVQPARFSRLAYGGALLTYGARIEDESLPSGTRLYFADGGRTSLEGELGGWAGTCGKDHWIWLSRDDNSVLVFDPRSGEEQFVLRGFERQCMAVSMDDQGRWIAVADAGRFSVRIFSGQAQEELISLAGHSNDIKQLEFSPGGEWLLSASDDFSVRVWKTGSWEQVTVLDTHGGMDVRATFHPDGTRLASVSSDGFVRIWDTASWDEVLAIRLPAPAGPARSLGFSQNGEQLMAVMGSGLHVMAAR